VQQALGPIFDQIQQALGPLRQLFGSFGGGLPPWQRPPQV
jgi:hypothetical protein